MCRGGGSGSLSILSDTPLNALINGNIAVQFFFLLSGFLAALTIFAGRDSQSIAFRAVKRYLRYLPMIAGATIFTFILMKARLMFHLEICDLVTNGLFLADYNNFIPTVKNLLYNIFVRPFILSSEYVGPFWYIKPDFWGYLIALGICIISKGYRWRRIAYILILIILWWNHNLDNYSTFILGIIVADLFYYTDAKTTYLSKHYIHIINCRLFAITGIIVGSYLAMIPISMSPYYSWLPCIDSGFWQFDEIGAPFYRAIGLAISIYSIIHLKPIKRILEHKFLLWMGKVSFATYAFHWPIMLSLEAYLFMTFIERYDYNVSALTAFALTLPAIYLTSFIATKYIDKPINLNKICRYLRTKHY